MLLYILYDAEHRPINVDNIDIHMHTNIAHCYLCLLLMMLLKHESSCKLRKFNVCGQIRTNIIVEMQ